MDNIQEWVLIWILLNIFDAVCILGLHIRII
jgi:hypothetical protein